jgi:Ca2+/H+ antiporter
MCQNLISLLTLQKEKQLIAKGSLESTIMLILHIIVGLSRKGSDKGERSQGISFNGVLRMGYIKVCTCAHFFVRGEQSAIKYGALSI